MYNFDPVWIRENAISLVTGDFWLICIGVCVCVPEYHQPCMVSKNICLLGSFVQF